MDSEMKVAAFVDAAPEPMRENLQLNAESYGDDWEKLKAMS